MSTIYDVVVIFRPGFGRTARESQALLISREFFKNYLDPAESWSPFGHYIVIGQKKDLDEDSLRRLILEQPWLRPETVQVFIRSEHDDKFVELVFDEPQGYISPGCSAWSLPTKEMLDS